MTYLKCKICYNEIQMKTIIFQHSESGKLLWKEKLECQQSSQKLHDISRNVLPRKEFLTTFIEEKIKL